MEELTREQTERLGRITDRIIDASFTNEQKVAFTSRDGKVQSLEQQFKVAKDKNNVLTMAIITRQLKARFDELLNDYALRQIKTLVNNGDIIMFMDEEEREGYNSVRGRVFLLMDALDSAFLDMQQILERNGVPGSVGMLTQIRDARSAIDRWSNETLPVMKTEASVLAGEESDRIYEYVSKRTEVLSRKANRLIYKNTL